MKAKWLIGLGIAIIVLTSLSDIIMGKGQIIFGPKSYSALAAGIILVVVGMTFRKKKVR